MNRLPLALAALLGASMPLIFDSALKGTALLALAALTALAMWRASAAARHLVWLVAVVALLLVPLLSLALPQWRVLPGWAASPLDSAPSVPAADPGTSTAVYHPIPEAPPATPPEPLPGARPAIPPPVAAPLPPNASPRLAPLPSPSEETARGWRDWLPLVWAAGFALLALRLLAAHWLLRRAARGCPPLTAPPDDAIAAAYDAACAHLGLRRGVTLLLDARRTIPVVWGVFRPRLLLPAEARGWSDEQLRSVLLHELSHVKRRDTLVQWLTQVACALHWWNPLMWLAAWRLHAERERACDDLVLASGVRPSAYAGHLLDVATRLSPARWTAACGLAMARKSSLESRLLAVLSDRRNRRAVTSALAATALLLGTGLAIPLAMLGAAEADKPEADAPAVQAEPTDPRSKPLFENWLAGARNDGKIPGGRIAEMEATLRTFIDLNPGHEQSVKLEPVLEKCDATRDWPPAEAAALLDEIAAIASQAEWTMRAITERTIHPGKPLPDELATAPWGQPAANGLRMAWLLEPRAETQALDSVMKSRVLFHNAGKAPVCFATEDWIQTGGHQAKDANGKDISVWAVSRLGIRLPMNFRLAPGEYAEVEGHGLGVGSHETSSEKSIYQVGGWIEAKEGDVVTFTPGGLPVSFQTWKNNEGLKDSVTVWNEMIAARVMREGPLPASAADRELLLRRVMQDFPGTAPTAEEIAAFTADNAPDALAKLVARLQARSAPMHFAGELSGGETKFRVTAAGAKEEPKQGPDAGVQPKHESAQSLFRKWQARARTDGKIPGALVGHLAREIDSFLKQHPESEGAPRLATLRPRLDASRDWTQEEVVALLDEITAAAIFPVDSIHFWMPFFAQRLVRGGQPLPVELEIAAWGPPAENGLRAAWLIEPRAEQYALGSVLKARVLFHNTGNAPVLFKTETWHQYDDHIARDAAGAEIKVSGPRYSGITPMATFHLASGEYCEVLGHGIAIGAGEYAEERSIGSVGAIIEAKEGDTVTLSHSVDAAQGGWTRPGDPKDPAELWKAIIAERVANEAPMPATPADREQLICRVTLDMLGVAPTADEIAAFIADEGPDALAKLTARLQAKPHPEPWAGTLPTGVTKFVVVAADPDAAKAPRTATAPGRYVLRDGVHLQVTQTTIGEMRTNKATLLFLSPDPKVASPHAPYEIALPDGLDSYCFIWERGSGTLMLVGRGFVRRVDFSNPASVKETQAKENLSPQYKSLLPPGLLATGASGSFDKSAKAPAVAHRPKLPDESYVRTGVHCQKFREEDAKRPGGELMGEVVEPEPAERGADPLVLGLRVVSDAKWIIGGEVRVELVVRNASGSDVKFPQNSRSDLGLSVVAIDKGGKEHKADILQIRTRFLFNHLMLPSAHIVRVKAFTIRFQPEKRDVSQRDVAAFHLPPGDYTLRCKWSDALPEVAHEGEWTGELVSGDHKFTLAAAAEPPASETPKNGAQLQPATEQKLKWGEPANGLRMALAWPPTLGEQAMGDEAEFYLVVQNVSETAVRLAAGDDAPNPRKLMMREDGRPLQAISDPVPAPGDWLLQPREVAFLRLYQSNANWKDGRTVSSAIEQDIRTVPRYSMTAEMTIEKAPAGAWTGKLITGETRGSADVILPKHKDAQALYESWSTASRVNGDIPGALIGLLAESVKLFIKSNPTGETVPHLESMLPRFDASHDWAGQDAVALLDELAAVQDSPVAMALEQENAGIIRTGAPLPPELTDAPWGGSLPNGLRHAWLLEPRAREHRLGSALKARVLLHNSGEAPVVFRARSWQQPGYKATDAEGAEIKTESTDWMTRGLLLTYRLAPGEFLELSGPSIGIGPKGEAEDWQHTRVGTWIEAKAGDEVTVMPGLLSLMEDVPNGPTRWWHEHVSARLARHLPFPANADARLRLLHRVAIEVLGTSVSKKINDSFVADTTPTALDSVAHHLTGFGGLLPFVGTRGSAPTQFRVLPADPDAAKRPRTATAPGRYVLGDGVHLQVRQVTEGGQLTNKAQIAFVSPDPEKESPLKPYEIKFYVPDAAYAFVWQRGANTLWVTEISEGEDLPIWIEPGGTRPGPQKVTVRAFEFSNPAEVKLTHVSSSENGGDWSWGKIVPAAFHQPVLDALGERGKRLRDFTEPPHEKPQGAAVDGAPAGELVFIPRNEKRPIPVFDAGDGVTLAIHEEVFHGADVLTKVRIRYTAADGAVTGHDVDVAGDAFGNREQWAFLWVRGAKSFWHVNGEFDGKRLRLYRTDFADPRRIVTAYDANYEGEPLDALGIPPDVRAKFEQHFGVANPKPVDKSGGLPDVAGEFVAAARALAADGSVPAVAGNPAGQDTRWKVRFVDAATGEVVPSLRAKVISRTADGARTAYVTRVVSDGIFERNLGGDEYAWVSVDDEKLTNAEDGERLFGNVPASLAAVEKHTNPNAPFIVKVKAREKTAKFTPDALLGMWRGTVNEEKLMLSFHRPPAETEVRLDIYFGEATIGVPASFTIAEDGRSAAVVRHSAGGGMAFGTLIPAKAGKLELKLDGRQKGQMEVTLTRDPDGPATEPRQAEARELFDLWKRTANDDGTIPGTFIGKLATEVRAYVKANPNLDSAMKLPKLLPRFVTSRDWTQAEAIKLLDDVAFYSTAPIEARVAKAKLPSGPLWRTMVEFEDIPVAIAKWGEAKDGLRVGMRVVEADWHIGGKALVELWLHNAGDKDVTFKTTGADRQDVGVAVSAIDTEGRELWAENGNVLIIAIPVDCTLPAGHVAMAKTLEVTFPEPDSAVKAWFAPRFRDLKPGKYQLRCKWVDAQPTVSKPGDWTGELMAPEIEFTLGRSDAAAPKAAADAVKFPDEEYAKDGFPLEDLDGEGVMWNGEETELSLGHRITGDEWRILGKELKVEMWVRNAGKEDLKFQILRRPDEGMRLTLTGKDGTEHVARMVPNDVPLFGMKHRLSPGQCLKVNDFFVGLLPPEQSARIDNELRFFVAPGWYQFECELKVPGFSATRSDGRQTVPGAGEWTGAITTRSLNVKVVAHDAPPPKPRVEWMHVKVSKDGAISLDRNKVTLDELKERAAKNVTNRFDIGADEDVPFAKVVEVFEALKAAGVTDISFSKDRVSGG